jgi:D-beta-D-heptose 7-phosphate kinase/D-beta-D-heptose 1-phosphate adenosyltransferase
MICVIGDYINDQYIYGTMTKISSESPIPIFLETPGKFEVKEGGAANVRANLGAFGVGKIRFYGSMRNKTIKSRFVVDNRIVFRADNEEYVPYTHLDFDLEGVTHCIISDYNKGMIHEPEAIIKLCKEHGCKIIVDPKKPLQRYAGADIVKLNKKEFDEYCHGMTPTEVREKYEIGALIVTLGPDGVAVYSDEYTGNISSDSHQIHDVTGAGDVFIAAMTHYLERGEDLYNSCRKANILAGISVTKFGTYVLRPVDIAQARTVFTNGCFDILHKGHIDYLRESKKLGAKLIVGLNSDASVARLKGKSRPINNQEDRKAVLLALDCVDEVIIFEEDTPYELIKSLKPDVITKGGDYAVSDVAGNDLAEVVIIPFTVGYSTTKILEKCDEVHR